MPKGLAWVLSILAAAVPLVLFVVSLSIFETGDRYLETVIASEGFGPAILVDFPSARLAISTTRYGVWVFGHVLLCLGVSVYFFGLLRRRSASSTDGRFPWIGVLAAYAGGVIAVLAYLTLTPTRDVGSVETPFADLVIMPFYLFLEAQNMAGQFPGFGNDPWLYLATAVLCPTALGIVCVVAASGLFHHMVLNRKARGIEGWEDDVVKCLFSLKQNAAVLSLILVSSTLTARAYFHLVPGLIAETVGDPAQPSAIHAVYKNLADTLSTGTGVLFSMTLIAAFAPGLVNLLGELTQAAHVQKGDERHPLMERLDLADFRAKLTSILRMGLTIASPALAAPVVEALQTL